MRTREHESLAAALALRPRELVAFVGGGGKTGALWTLAGESAGVRVLATTTTAMFLRELQTVGPVLMGPDRNGLLTALPFALSADGALAAARDLAQKGKVTGLPPEWVDEIWLAGTTDVLLVEADGSRGLPLKAFGPHEPQVPREATLIVQVAGLDALGAPLDADHVHRPERLLRALSRDAGRPVLPGEPLDAELLVVALREQLRTLRARWPAARLVTLLNKAEDHRCREAGLDVAVRMLAQGADAVAPEAVVVGSLQERVFTRCVPEWPLVSALVLAAGRSARMGTQKLLLQVEGRPMVEHAVIAAVQSRVAETIVVLGSDADAVRAAVAGHLTRAVVNPDYEQGMSGSLRTGLSAARPDHDAVLFVLGDQPFVRTAAIDRLIDRFGAGAGIVRPVTAGRPGHPVLMGAHYAQEILALSGDVGAREILNRHPGEVALVELGDDGSNLDVDTPEDYSAATASQASPPGGASSAHRQEGVAEEP